MRPINVLYIVLTILAVVALLVLWSEHVHVH